MDSINVEELLKEALPVCLPPPLDVVPGHPLALHLLDLDVLAKQQTVGHGSDAEVVNVMPGINSKEK